ncbi:MAG: PPA1309 family protein, partial [Actinomycetota bacterium]|nr:PPA1309 family protein [Actinomycetota bacterium]
MPPLLGVLDAVTAEIEAFVASAGWDQPPALFALVPTVTVAADAQGAKLLGPEGTSGITAQSLTPIAQDALPDQPLDEALAGIEWPPQVTGCALAQEIVMLPPEAEAALSHPLAVSEAAAHPQRREARLVVAVLRDGQAASVLRLRAGPPADPA